MYSALAAVYWLFVLPNQPDSTRKGILRPTTVQTPCLTQQQPLQAGGNAIVPRGLSKRIQIAMLADTLIPS
jgi:hypothetical protein